MDSLQHFQKELNIFIDKYWLQITFNPNSAIFTILELLYFRQPDFKLQATLNFDRQSQTIACFESTMDLQQFMQNPQNYTIDISQKQLSLNWQLTAQNYKKNIRYHIKFREQSMQKLDRLKLQNFILRKQLYQLSMNNFHPLNIDVQQSKALNEKNRQLQQVQDTIKLENNITVLSNIPNVINTNEKIQNENIIIHKKKAAIPKNQSIPNTMNKVKRTKQIGKNLKQPRKRTIKMTMNNTQNVPLYTQQLGSQNNMRQPSRIKSESKIQIQENLEGKTQDGQRLKKVRLEFQNQDYYEGQILNNIYHGYGVYQSKLGSLYQGYWKQGKHDGYGVSIDQYGNKYTGKFKEDKKHGQGLQVYANGQKYQGTFHQDAKNGYGKYYYQNGDIYEGEWVDNVCWGKGKQIYTDGSYYQGYWLKDDKHGRGILTDKDGSKILQIYDCDKLTGQFLQPIDQHNSLNS